MNKKAFTLIEMMIAVFIMSMLLVVATPIYKKRLLKSRTEEAKVVIQSIIFAEERYKQENGNFFPKYNTDSIPANSEVKNEKLIAEALKINLSQSNNFNYTIKDLSGSDDGNFTIRAILRADSWDICTDGMVASTICKQNNTIDEDSWVKEYNRDENKHYLEFRYPNKLTGDYVEGGVSYEHLYDN